jgi:glycerol-3-phosphate acyltransferase PlsY
VSCQFLFFCALLLAYVLGSIPFGFLVAKARGTNILAVGSGNMGATNVRRTVGRWAGISVFFLDAAKGFLALHITRVFPKSALDPSVLAAAALTGAFLGHNFSIFLKFRGGKGVSVTIGGLLSLMPNVLFIGLLTWVVVFAATRFVSLASVCFSLTLPLCSYLFAYPFVLNFLILAISAFIIGRHLSNIRRLIAGTEYRFERRET